MVNDHQGQHRFGNGRCANAHAGVMSALGEHLNSVALNVDGRTGNQNRAGGLDGNRHLKVLTRTDTTQHTARIVTHEAIVSDGVAMLTAF